MADSMMQAVGTKLSISPAILQALKDLIWLELVSNKDKTITLKVWFLRKTFRLEDLFPAFELVLGPPPVP